MTTIGDTTCGLSGRADNCWKPLSCQMDVYYDNRVELPWIKPEIIRDNRTRNLSSSQFLVVPPEKWPPEGKGGPFGGGGLRHGKFSQGGGILAMFDREFQTGIGLISWAGSGLCPQYTGPDAVVMTFENFDDYQKYSKGEIPAKDVRITHQIEFPRAFLERAKALYETQNKPNDETINRLKQQFLDSRKPAIPDSQPNTAN